MKPTIASALRAAEATADEDTVRIGPGTYSGDQRYDGSSPIQIIGAGRNRTRLVKGGLAVTVPSGGSSVRGLTIDLPSGAGGGLGVENVDVRRVNVRGPESDGVTGIALEGGSVRDSRVALPHTGFHGNVGISAFAGARISEVSVKATLAIAAGPYTNPPHITRARIVVKPAGGASRGDPDSIGVAGDARISDSLINVDTGEVGLSTLPGNDFNLPPPNTEMDADHVTIVGPSTATGFVVAAVGNAPTFSETATGTFTNSVIFGPGVPIVRRAYGEGATANVTTDYSSYDTAGDVDSNAAGGSGATSEANLVVGTPTFMDPSAGNFRPAAGSILVDAGDPAFTPPAMETDLDGGARIVDGNRDDTAVTDVGAYERENVPPSVDITSGPERRTRDQTPKFTFESDDPNASFECRLDARPYTPCSSPKRYRKLSLGGHRFRVRPTDPYGNVGERMRRRFQIIAGHRAL